ncbi:MAG: Crp/Fnr family transcriptional regulator [Gammaproteobacteria bacterium]|nr:MAG: Crp/Fnr family transcriptional regulator [Gammaproteobacteria bacterium]
MDVKIFDQIPLFEKLDDEEREKLASRFVLRRYQKNTVIINEGDDSRSFYVIIDGQVKIYLTDENGKEIVLNKQSAGEYFGEVALLDEGLRSASVITTQPGLFAVLNQQAFTECISDNPQISLKIMQGLTQRLRALSDNVRSLALMDVYGRVARLLLDEAVEQDGIKIIENKLTQNDIAARIGASSKMVGRIMQDLKKGGYICKDDKRLIIARPLPPAW